MQSKNQSQTKSSKNQNIFLKSSILSFILLTVFIFPVLTFSQVAEPKPPPEPAMVNPSSNNTSSISLRSEAISSSRTITVDFSNSSVVSSSSNITFKDVKVDESVRSGGLEVGAILSLLIFIILGYYYYKQNKNKSSLKMAEKKIR
jgi:hypothetical protein